MYLSTQAPSLAAHTGRSQLLTGWEGSKTMVQPSLDRTSATKQLQVSSANPDGELSPFLSEGFLELN